MCPCLDSIMAVNTSQDILSDTEGVVAPIQEFLNPAEVEVVAEVNAEAAFEAASASSAESKAKAKAKETAKAKAKPKATAKATAKAKAKAKQEQVQPKLNFKKPSSGSVIDVPENEAEADVVGEAGSHVVGADRPGTMRADRPGAMIVLSLRWPQKKKWESIAMWSRPVVGPSW